MDGLLIALVVAALLIGGLLIVFIQLTSDSVQMAIVKADKLLDKAMRDCGVAGATMGDRLKSRKGDWTDENGLWAAHKLRNQIAHETKVKLTAQSFRRAMTSFEQALKDLGAL